MGSTSLRQRWWWWWSTELNHVLVAMHKRLWSPACWLEVAELQPEGSGSVVSCHLCTLLALELSSHAMWVSCRPSRLKLSSTAVTAGRSSPYKLQDLMLTCAMVMDSRYLALVRLSALAVVACLRRCRSPISVASQSPASNSPTQPINTR